MIRGKQNANLRHRYTIYRVKVRLLITVHSQPYLFLTIKIITLDTSKSKLYAGIFETIKQFCIMKINHSSS